MSISVQEQDMFITLIFSLMEWGPHFFIISSMFSSSRSGGRTAGWLACACWAGRPDRSRISEQNPISLADKMRAAGLFLSGAGARAFHV